MEKFNIGNVIDYIDNILNSYNEIHLTHTIHNRKIYCSKIVREENYNFDKKFIDIILNRENENKYSYVHYNYSIDVDEMIIDNIIEFCRILNNYMEYRKNNLFIKYVTEDKGYLYFTYNKKVYKLSYSYGISISKVSAENVKLDKLHSFKFEDLKEFSEKQVEISVANDKHSKTYAKKKQVKKLKIS